MYLNLIILLAIFTIAFFHYTQGLFSATLSAIIAVIAAALAIGYHENLVALLNRGGLVEYANSIALVAIFAGVYIVLRAAFDKLIPGNVRVPVLADKIGAGAMGFVAAVFAVGIAVLAAYALPFGPKIGAFAQQEMQDFSEDEIILHVQGGRSDLNAKMDDVMKGYSLDDEETAHSLWFPVDRLVTGFASHVSNGSLAGTRPLTDIHPDYPIELFGQRLGIQVGAKHVAMVSGRSPDVEDEKVFLVKDKLPRVEGVSPDIRKSRDFSQKPLTTGGGQSVVVARVGINSSAAEKDGIFHFSTGSVRLVGKDAEGKGKNFYPEGILQGGQVRVYKPDDFLFLDVSGSGKASVDLVFKVDDDSLVKGKTGKSFADGVFLEVKRLGHLDLSGKSIEEVNGAPAGGSASLLIQQYNAPQAPAPTPRPTPAPDYGPSPTPPPAPTPQPGEPGGVPVPPPTEPGSPPPMPPP